MWFNTWHQTAIFHSYKVDLCNYRLAFTDSPGMFSFLKILFLCWESVENVCRFCKRKKTTNIRDHCYWTTWISYNSQAKRMIKHARAYFSDTVWKGIWHQNKHILNWKWSFRSIEISHYLYISNVPNIVLLLLWGLWWNFFFYISVSD